jgi:hypothetical protein
VAENYQIEEVFQYLAESYLTKMRAEEAAAVKVGAVQIVARLFPIFNLFFSGMRTDQIACSFENIGGKTNCEKESNLRSWELHAIACRVKRTCLWAVLALWHSITARAHLCGAIPEPLHKHFNLFFEVSRQLFYNT